MRRKINMNREDEVGVKGFEAFQGVALFIIITARDFRYPFTAKVNQNKSQKKDKNSVKWFVISTLYYCSAAVVGRSSLSLLTTHQKPSAGDLDLSSYTITNLEKGETSFSHQMSKMLHITSMWSYRASQKNNKIL